MADIIDVQNAIVALIANTVYPNGTSQAPAQGVQAQIFAGWPTPANLDAQMAAGNACIWVHSRPEVREATRYPSVWQTQSIVAPTLTAKVSGNTVTIGGTMPSPFSTHNMFVLMDGQAFSYSVQPSDTLSTIATALANLIAAAYPGTTSSGAVITIPKGPIPVARVGTIGTSVLEVGRFEQTLQIVIATNKPDSRSALSAAIMPVLMTTAFLTMPDGVAARLIVRAPVDMDEDQKVQVFRRDIKVTAEYAITETMTSATVETVQTTFSDIYASTIPSRSF